MENSKEDPTPFSKQFYAVDIRDVDLNEGKKEPNTTDQPQEPRPKYIELGIPQHGNDMDDDFEYLAIFVTRRICNESPIQSHDQVRSIDEIVLEILLQLCSKLSLCVRGKVCYKVVVETPIQSLIKY
jgi:hypothetical protein